MADVVPPLLDRSRDAVVRAATSVLVAAPQTTLAELATALGIGRTTLHRLFPTREDLLRAVAHDALDTLAAVYAEAGLASPLRRPGEALPTVRRLVSRLVPLGPSLVFLLRAAELQDDGALTRRTAEVDEPLVAFCAAAQRHGDLDPALPAWWVAETLLATVFVGWQKVAEGRLARLDAPDLVVRTWLSGVSPAA